MLRTAVVLMWFAVLPLVMCQQPPQTENELQSMPSPTVPYYDWKACPFEGCTYREWTARQPASVYNTWKRNRRAIARLSTGEAVTGLTGVVVTYRPGKIRMDRDLPELGLKRGETILTYAYRGEGFSAVWFKGSYHPEFDISFTKWPDGGGCNGASCAATYIDLGEKVWWAQIKLTSGRTGWVNMNDAKFDGVDMLARHLTLPVVFSEAAKTSS